MFLLPKIKNKKNSKSPLERQMRDDKLLFGNNFASNYKAPFDEKDWNINVDLVFIIF